MADELDRAADLQAAEIETAIAAHAARKRPEPSDYCDDCDEPLEEHRRQYGRCVPCQSARELRGRHYRKE